MEGQAHSEPARSDTERAVALAHLLHQDCKQLLHLYKERETFLSENEPDSERLVTFTICSDDPTSAEQVSRAHSALRQCLEMLECLIRLEAGEMEEEMEGEYENTRKMVKDRIGHLLHSIGTLLESSKDGCTPSSEIQCVQSGSLENSGCRLKSAIDCSAEGLDEVEGPGSFAAKLWTYRVLLELIHWSDSVSRALHLLHSERQSEQNKQEL